MSYRVQGLDPQKFSHLKGISDAELARHGARRYVVDAKPGFPDRIAVRDLDIGEHAILLNYEHQPADTPYRSRHAIFVHEEATDAFDQVDTIPEAIRTRMISLRAFNTDGEILKADLAEGNDLTGPIERLFEDPEVSYLHAHYAARGCYAARIVRA